MPTDRFSQIRLDSYDHALLAALQLCSFAAGWSANQRAIGRRDWAVASPCLRRVRNVEEAGVIRGYQATLDAEAIGLGMTVFVGGESEMPP